MVYPVLGQLVIVLMMLICCSRIFFLKFGKVDVLTVLAPVSLILSILQIFSWKLDFNSAIIFVLSLVVFIINFRALLRFAGGLYVDHYSIAFKIGACFMLLLELAVLVFILMFFPYAIFDKNFKAEKEIVRVEGTFKTGFRECGLFSISDGTINVFSSAEKSNVVVLFIPDKRGDTDNYEPFLKALAEKGYTVYSGDFFANDVKWFYSISDKKFLRKNAMLYKYFSNEVIFNSEKEFYTYNTLLECEAIYKFAKERQPDAKFVLLGDGISNTGIEDYAKTHRETINAFEFLEKSDDYQTPGFGFIQNLNPLISRIMGYERLNDFENCRRVADSVNEKIRGKDTDSEFVFERDVKRAEADKAFEDYIGSEMKLDELFAKEQVIEEKNDIKGNR